MHTKHKRVKQNTGSGSHLAQRLWWEPCPQLYQTNHTACRTGFNESAGNQSKRTLHPQMPFSLKPERGGKRLSLLGKVANLPTALLRSYELYGPTEPLCS
jgi:hypothetical protein